MIHKKIPFVVAALLVAFIALAFQNRLDSQTVIRPSKNDRILGKLDTILKNQKAMGERLKRIEAKLGIVPAKSTEKESTP